MTKELKCIMLIDDDVNDNYFHERIIKQSDPTITVIEEISGIDALEYLIANKENSDLLPDLIFLDINMPCINGWEFLQKYKLLKRELPKEISIIMLSTSDNPDDIQKSKTWSFVINYINKPLSIEIMEDINKKYFKY